MSGSCWTATADGPARRASRPPRKDTRRARITSPTCSNGVGVWASGWSPCGCCPPTTSAGTTRRSSLLTIISDVVDDLAAPDQPWKLRIVGSMDVLPAEMATQLLAAELRTADRDGIEVNIAVGYGGRQEIADAVRSLLEAKAEAGESLRQADRRPRRRRHRRAPLHIGPARPRPGDPDLREQRLSGFLLWQSVHSEFWFCDAYWPDFRRVDFLRALRDYAARHRRFGE